MNVERKTIPLWHNHSIHGGGSRSRSTTERICLKMDVAIETKPYS